jgi:hypothetical protein
LLSAPEITLIDTSEACFAIQISFTGSPAFTDLGSGRASTDGRMIIQLAASKIRTTAAINPTQARIDLNPAALLGGSLVAAVEVTNK